MFVALIPLIVSSPSLFFQQSLLCYSVTRLSLHLHFHVEAPKQLLQRLSDVDTLGFELKHLSSVMINSGFLIWHLTSTSCKYILHSSDTFVMSVSGIFSCLATYSIADMVFVVLFSGFKQERNLSSLFPRGSLVCRKFDTLPNENLIHLPNDLDDTCSIWWIQTTHFQAQIHTKKFIFVSFVSLHKIKYFFK